MPKNPLLKNSNAATICDKRHNIFTLSGEKLTSLPTQKKQQLRGFAAKLAEQLAAKTKSTDPLHNVRLIEQAFEQWSQVLFPQFSWPQDAEQCLIKAACIKHVFFDFDGVLTDNKVYTDQAGNESVACDRADGLGIKQLKSQGKSVYILSTETNPVVQQRADKLGIPCVQACKDKAQFMREWLQSQQVEPRHVAFVGNDINDLGVMQEVGLSFCPADSDASILTIADCVLSRNGGDKVVREVAALLATE